MNLNSNPFFISYLYCPRLSVANPYATPSRRLSELVGWGPPPAYQWQGGPPHPFSYWGYDVNPVWDDGFHGWGIWLFGLWIPVFGIGVS